MAKVIAAILFLALMVAGVPADAAKHHRKHRKHHHVTRVHHAAAPSRKVATKAEYNRLRGGMTYGQVAAVFDAPSRLTRHKPFAIFVGCPSGAKFFCLADDGVTGTGTITAAGPEDDYEWFTGIANRYDYSPGRKCYAIQTYFVQDAAGVYRLVQAENWSNICYTYENR